MASNQKTKQTHQSKERVRYEVYGMPIENIIEGALTPEREAAEAKAHAKAEAAAAAQPQAEAWPSLEDLKAEGPRARPRSRR